MKIHNVTQGSSKWLSLRMGKPTASDFDKIVTPTGKVSSQQSGYLNKLLAELVMGHPIAWEELPWMTRGKDLEATAVEYFELQEEVETEPVGFMTNDEETIGASPDRLIPSRKRLLEIKCPSPQVQIAYLMGAGVDQAYYPQIQGQLYVAGQEWGGVDICAYHPEMPRAIVRVDRDEKFIKILDEQLSEFVGRLKKAIATLTERGYIMEPKPEKEWITAEDEEQIIAARFGKGVLQPE